MAHVFDTKAQAPAAASTVGYTALTCVLTINCAVDATLLSLVIVNGTTTHRTGGSPTYNGTVMTNSPASAVSSGGEVMVENWYMLSPPTGGDFIFSVPNNARTRLRLIASSYKATSGMTSTIDAASTRSSAASTNPTCSITTSIAGDVIIGGCGDGLATAPTGRTHTSLYENDDGSFSRNAQYFLQAGAGATTLSWTLASDDWAVSLLAFKETTVTTSTVKIMPKKRYHWSSANYAVN